MKEEALKYLSKGYSIFPLRPDKRPYINKWEPYQTKSADKEQIEKWWARWPKANIAIVCGEISGIMVIDVDTKEAKESIEEFLPESLVIPTITTPSGGWHFYFKFKSGLTNKVNALPGIDIRTQGGYSIAAPSHCVYEKKGNTIDGKHSWGNGFGVLYPAELPEIPSMLFDTLEQACNSYNSSIINNSMVSNITSCIEPTTSHSTTNGNNDHNRPQIFFDGSRDSDLFHAANCLIKGGCAPEFTEKVIEILAKNCNPPFPESESKIKIKSAIQRAERRERNISAEVREWVTTTSGHFSTTNCHNELQTTTKQEKKAINMALLRLVDEGLIEKTGDKAGEYRTLDTSCTPMDWVNADENYIPFWLPLGLDQIAGVLPGNILMFVGSKDAGKTPFCMNIAKENRHNYKVHYFNSEMGAAEFKLRASLFDDIHVSQWNNIDVYERNKDFHDVVKPGEGNLNIIDYLEAPDEVWKIGSWIQKIHAKLKGAVCVIALQKKIGSDLGRGAEFSMEKARLYVSLEYGKAKIISCKNFLPTSPIGNPRGQQCFYKLVNGAKIIKDRQLGWHRPPEKEK